MAIYISVEQQHQIQTESLIQENQMNRKETELMESLFIFKQPRRLCTRFKIEVRTRRCLLIFKGAGMFQEFFLYYAKLIKLPR